MTMRYHLESITESKCVAIIDKETGRRAERPGGGTHVFISLMNAEKHLKTLNDEHEANLKIVAAEKEATKSRAKFTGADLSAKTTERKPRKAKTPKEIARVEEPVKKSRSKKVPSAQASA